MVCVEWNAVSTKSDILLAWLSFYHRLLDANAVFTCVFFVTHYMLEKKVIKEIYKSQCLTMQIL